MKPPFPIPRFLRRLCDDERASISVEAILVVPFLVWAFLGVFTIADGFRTLHSNVVSSYSLADGLSRETEPIDAAYLDGLNRLHRILTRTRGETDVRITVLRQNRSGRMPDIEWSHAAGTHQPMTNADLSAVIDQIPELGDGESVIVLETWNGFTPLTSYLLDPLEFHSLVVTRPRFAPQLLWDG